MLRLVGWLLVLMLVGVCLLPFAMLEATPAVEADLALAAAEVARAKALVAEHNPHRLRDGEVRALALSAAEVSLVLNYLLDQLGGGASQVRVAHGNLSALVTRQLPANPLGSYLNAQIDLAQTDALPRIEQLRVGRLRIPGLLADPLFGLLTDAARAAAGLPAAKSLLQHVSFSADGIALQYQWDTRVVSAVREQLIPAEEAARLREFHFKLVAVVRERQRAMTLAELAAPLFAFGVTRASSGDPVADNRAALMVLSSYVTGARLTTLLPAAADWPTPTRYTVRVHGRHDLAKHFLNSAALSAAGGQVLAKALGLSKEIDDSRGGSGFSFIDLLADEAGTHFGERATRARVLAREIQQRAANARRDIDWMPSPEGLQEQMSEQDFKRRYGGIGGTGYQRVLADIERRIGEVALYR